MADEPGHELEVAARVGGPHPLDTDRQPWEKQSWESLPAFRAFALYRDLVFGASIRKAAELLAEEEGRTVSTITLQMGEWSGRHHWQERHTAYIRFLDQRAREQRESRIERQRRRYQGAAASLSAQIIERATSEDLAARFKTDDLDFAGAVRALRDLQQVEALATGQPTSLVKSAFQVSAVEVEQMARDLCEILFPYIPEERRPLAAQEVVAYSESGQRAIEAAS